MTWLPQVRAASEGAEAKKEREKEGGKAAAKEGTSPEHVFIRGVIALHDTFMNYVTECFAGSSLFHKALKEAFESFCNKQVAGASVAELMASFCDNLLRKGGGERLSDEDLDAVLDKVVRLLAYVSDKDLFSEFYRKRLSRRLMGGTSASGEPQRSAHSMGVIPHSAPACEPSPALSAPAPAPAPVPVQRTLRSRC